MVMRQELENYRYIIWDWNGTLLDDVWLCVETINSLLREYGLAEVDEEKYQENFDFPVRGYYEHLGFDFEKLSFEKIAVDFIERYYARLNECKMHPDAMGTLGHFQQAGCRQSVLSATKQTQLEHCVDHFGLRGYFERLMGLDNHYAASKVDEGKLLVADLDLPRKDILYIGDTLHDHEVAEEMGVDCVLIAQGHHHADRLAQCGCRVFNSLRALFE